MSARKQDGAIALSIGFGYSISKQIRDVHGANPNGAQISQQTRVLARTRGR